MLIVLAVCLIAIVAVVFFILTPNDKRSPEDEGSGSGARVFGLLLFSAALLALIVFVACGLSFRR